MNEEIGSVYPAAPLQKRYSRPLGVFAAWRLQAYGYTIAAFYAACFFYVYWLGLWMLNKNGMPAYQDFTNMFVAGWQALHGHAASVYVPAEHLRAQDRLIGAGHAVFSLWPYPPTYFLLLAPLAMLPYVPAFLIWCLATLSLCIAVVYLIVRRGPAIALALASPFNVWNILAGQSGFLTASLLGGSLLALERRPVLGGAVIGCLTYKPQWGILIPVALIAARQWRAVASATAATALLVIVSTVAFGIGPWEAFPHQLLQQAGINLSMDPDVVNLRFNPIAKWQYYQTMFGLIRALHGGAAAAWLVQGLTTAACAVVVFLVWRSPVRYALKAATLSAAALIATPYAFGYDMVAIAVPVAFLARDEIQYGPLKGEQAALLILVAASLLCNLMPWPLQPIVVIALLGIVLRRTFWQHSQSAVYAEPSRCVPGLP